MAAAETTILVVEDDPTVAHIYTLTLERAGYRVIVARDGADGVDKASTQAPDFIFLDIRMPKMDGIGVLHALSADTATRGIPVVMLSNYDDPALIRESMRLGAKEYLIKAGTNPTELGGIVERWLNSR